MERLGFNVNQFIQGDEFIKKLEIDLAVKLGLTDLGCGKQVIRDERGWRENSNPEELIQGIFSYDNKGIKDLYWEVSENKHDAITGNFRFDLFNANQGITLDGVSYTLRVIASNINTLISVHNPVTDEWKNWENEIRKLGGRLANKSNIPEITRVFE